MTTITFLGGEEAGNVGSVEWGKYTFVLGQPVPCQDKHIIAKARTNKFFRVGSELIGNDVTEAEVVEQTAPKRRGRPKKAVSNDGSSEA